MSLYDYMCLGVLCLDCKKPLTNEDKPGIVCQDCNNKKPQQLDSTLGFPRLVESKNED
jgi:hypothetical protein